MRRTIAQDVYERVQSMMAQGVGVTEALRRIAQESGKSHGSVVAAYYRWRNQLEGRTGVTRSSVRVGSRWRTGGQEHVSKEERAIEDLRTIIRQRSTELRALKAALHRAEKNAA
jgi:uncharacterized protein YoaH (UPF0181 family)